MFTKFLTGQRKNISWTIADQCVVSGANFLIGVALARFLGIQQFGVYTLGMIAVWFLLGINNALVYGPMLIVAVKQEKDRHDAYFTTVLCHQLIIVGGVAFVVVVGALFPESWSLFGLKGLSLPTVAPAAVGLVCQEFMRRYFYATRRPYFAFRNSTIFYGIQVICIGFLYYIQALSVENAFLTTACSAAVAICINLRKRPTISFKKNLFWETTLRHWRFSRWMIVTFCVNWFAGNFFYITAGIILGPVAVGAMRTASLTVAGGNIIMQALDNYLPTSFAHILHTQSFEEAWRHAKKVALVSILSVSAVSVVICAAPRFWLVLIFGPKYSGYEWLLYAFGVLNPLNTLFVLGAGIIFALEQPALTFVAYVVMTVFSASAATLLIQKAGLAGAVWGLVCAQTLGVICVAIGVAVARHRLQVASIDSRALQKRP